MAITCLFCGKDVTNDGGPDFRPSQTLYNCQRCGFVHLSREAVDDFNVKLLNPNAISITLRNNWERNNRKRTEKVITSLDLEQISNQFRALDPIEKMDHALIHLEKTTDFVGDVVKIIPDIDYPLYYCKERREIITILKLLANEGFILTANPHELLTTSSITTKGYQRLREIQKTNKNSRLCFVAMWFIDEMNDVFNNAIKPAIEYKEEGESESRFKAVKIDNVEHVNDINDEIIAQIRRSRFMVCDLSGYRGGVYFEAGFAYGLGLDVIYTCRKDWTKEEILKDVTGKELKCLYDSNRREIQIKKEGVHFDLAHRNRIEWEPDKLEDFKTKLENRIKAVIF